MDPIAVPAPPRSAYNPNRRVSDLIVGQLKHFQHLEQKRDGLNIDPATSRDIHTEAGAARYIAAMTRGLRGLPAARPAKITAMPSKKAATKTPAPGLAIAAAAAPPEKALPKKAAKKSPTKSASRSTKKSPTKKSTAKKSTAKKSAAKRAR